MIKEHSVISDIRTHAKTQIKGCDCEGIRCGTFDNLSRVCLYIAKNGIIRKSKVYPALRSIGYNLIYNNNHKNVDLLEELSDITSQSILSLDANMSDFHLSNQMGVGIDVFVCRIQRTAQKKILEYAGKYDIRVSTLNMYHTMLGIRELVKSDVKYAALRKTDAGKDVLSRLDRFETIVKNRTFDAKHGTITHNTIKEEMPSYNEKFIQMNVDVGSIGLEFVEYEYPMDIGRVDILCKSGDEFVLVEVKKGIVGTDVIGQVLKYVCTFGKPCKGMIIAEGFSKQVVNAANKLHIDLVKYTTWLDVDMRQHVGIRMCGDL